MPKYQVANDVMIRDDRDETFVFRSRSGRLYRVNDTVLTVLEALDEPQVEEELIRTLESDTEKPVPEQYTKQAISKATELGLVTEV
jgi:hypothetical protein